MSAIADLNSHNPHLKMNPIPSFIDPPGLMRGATTTRLDPENMDHNFVLGPKLMKPALSSTHHLSAILQDNGTLPKPQLPPPFTANALELNRTELRSQHCVSDHHNSPTEDANSPGHRFKTNDPNNYKKKLLMAAISNHSLHLSPLQRQNNPPPLPTLTSNGTDLKCDQDNSITTTKLSPQVPSLSPYPGGSFIQTPNNVGADQKVDLNLKAQRSNPQPDPDQKIRVGGEEVSLKRTYHLDDIVVNWPVPKKPSLFPSLDHNLPSTSGNWLDNYRVSMSHSLSTSTSCTGPSSVPHLRHPDREKASSTPPPNTAFSYHPDMTLLKPLDLAIKNKSIDDRGSCKNETHSISAPLTLTQSVKFNAPYSNNKIGENPSPFMNSKLGGLDFAQIPLLNSSPRLIEKAKLYWKEFIAKILVATKEEEQECFEEISLKEDKDASPQIEQAKLANLKVNTLQSPAENIDSLSVAAHTINPIASNETLPTTAKGLFSPRQLTVPNLDLKQKSGPKVVDKEQTTLSSIVPPQIGLVNKPSPTISTNSPRTANISQMVDAKRGGLPTIPSPQLPGRSLRPMNQNQEKSATDGPSQAKPNVDWDDNNKQPQVAASRYADHNMMDPYTASALYYYQQQQQQQYLLNVFGVAAMQQQQQQQHHLLDPAFLTKELAALYSYSNPGLLSNPYYFMLNQMPSSSPFPTMPPPLLPADNFPNRADMGTTNLFVPTNLQPQQPSVPVPAPPPTLANPALPGHVEHKMLHNHLTKQRGYDYSNKQQQPSFPLTLKDHSAHKPGAGDNLAERNGKKLSPDTVSDLSSSAFSAGPFSNESSPDGEKFAGLLVGSEAAKQLNDPNTSPNDILTNDSAVDLTFNEEDGQRKSNSSSKDSYLHCGEALNLSKKYVGPVALRKLGGGAEKIYSNHLDVRKEDVIIKDDDNELVDLSPLEKDKLEALALYNKLAETSNNEGLMTDADKNLVRQWNGTEDFLWEDVKYGRKSSSHHYNGSAGRRGNHRFSSSTSPVSKSSHQQQQHFATNGDNNTSGYDNADLFYDDENELDFGGGLDDRAFQSLGRPCNKDQRMALAMSLPFSIEDIVTSPIDTFSEILRKADLSVEQIGLVRDIRRRGKNKIAAQNCRKRKLDLIMYLGKNVDYLKATRNALIEEREELEKDIIDYHIKLENLYLETFKAKCGGEDITTISHDSRHIIPENYVFQFADKSNGHLIPQKQNMSEYTFTWEPRSSA